MTLKINTVVDYSVHDLEARKLMKQVHELLLKNKYKEAAEATDLVIAELRLFRAAIKNYLYENN